MTTARDLLAAGPDGYTAARDTAVKERRAAGDRTGANELKALTRPGLALWAVLAAGADEAVVRDAVEATSALAGVQGAASSRDHLVEATRARREAVEAVVDAAVGALAARGDARADDRRDEVRLIVDRLSRHPELAAAWLDATLRDLPDDDLGFGAFSGMAVAPAPRAAPARPRPAKAKATAGPAIDEPTAEDAARQAAIDAARRAVADADAAQGAAEHRLREAERVATAARKAEEATAAVLEAAQRAFDEAVARHGAAAKAADDADRVLAEATDAVEAARARREASAGALASLEG